MSKSFLNYLRAEHAKLDRLIEIGISQRDVDQVAVARLTKLKLAVADQIACEERALMACEAA